MTGKLIASLAVGAALILNVAPTHAGPCSNQIAQFEKAVRESASSPNAGPTANQSVGAQLSHQPTPGSLKQATERARAAFDTVMARARELDARGDRDGCMRALDTAKSMYNL